MTISIATLFLLLLTHTVADFVFQTDDMAKNKSTSNYWLVRHLNRYSVVLCIGMLLGFLIGLVPAGTFLLNSWFLAINYSAHGLTDYITSRITSYYWKLEKRHQFFITIGFDQLAHLVVLVLSYVLLFG